MVFLLPLQQTQIQQFHAKVEKVTHTLQNPLQFQRKSAIFRKKQVLNGQINIGMVVSKTL